MKSFPTTPYVWVTLQQLVHSKINFTGNYTACTKLYLYKEKGIYKVEREFNEDQVCIPLWDEDLTWPQNHLELEINKQNTVKHLPLVKNFVFQHVSSKVEPSLHTRPFLGKMYFNSLPTKKKPTFQNSNFSNCSISKTSLCVNLLCQ